MSRPCVRVDSATYAELKRLAIALDTSVGNTVTIAIRALRQDRIGRDLATPLRPDESDWLDAELG